MIKEYLDLINNFIDGEISAHEFEMRYIEKFEDESRKFPHDGFDALSDVFTACDAYCADPELRGQYDLDEKGFLEEVKSAAERLKMYIV